MNTTKGNLDATPNKRIYRSIIADYNINTAIAELIDNAIDVKTQTRGGPTLVVKVEIDVDQQSIIVQDNAGGVKEAELKKLVSPGDSSLDGSDESIGIFGVGSKRSVVALAQSIRITSRFKKEGTYRVEYDDEWLESDNWLIPYGRAPEIPPSTTIIKLSNLRFRIDENELSLLANHLSEVYGMFLRDEDIVIELRGEQIVGSFFNTWAYPQGYEPQNFTKRLVTRIKKQNVNFSLTGGIIRQKGMVNDYGFYLYCNRRLVARSLRSQEVGFMSGVAGVPHASMALARVIVELNGPASEMPWNSSKSGINYNHFLFEAIKADIVQAVKTYALLSKRLYGDFNEMVEPFASGEIIRVHPFVVKLINKQYIKC